MSVLFLLLFSSFGPCLICLIYAFLFPHLFSSPLDLFLTLIASNVKVAVCVSARILLSLFLCFFFFFPPVLPSLENDCRMRTRRRKLRFACTHIRASACPFVCLPLRILHCLIVCASVFFCFFFLTYLSFLFPPFCFFFMALMFQIIARPIDTSLHTKNFLRRRLRASPV